MLSLLVMRRRSLIRLLLVRWVTPWVPIGLAMFCLRVVCLSILGVTCGMVILRAWETTAGSSCLGRLETSRKSAPLYGLLRTPRTPPVVLLPTVLGS